MEHRKCKALVQSDCGKYLVSGNQSVMLTSAKSHHSSFSDEVSCANAYTANTTTSLSTVRIRILLYVLAAWATLTIMRLSASSCEQGLVPHCPLVADKVHPCLECRWLACQLRSWRFLAQKREQLCLVLVNSEKLCPFFRNCIIGLHSATNSFPSHFPRLRFQGIMPVIVPHHVDSLCFIQLMLYVRKEGKHSGHIPGKFWLLLASACARWQVRLTQQLRHLLLCHLAPLWHLRGTEQCPTWCPVWVSLCLTVTEDTVGSRERNIHRGYHHETEMQHTISRKGCDNFSAMAKFTSFGLLTLVWCFEQVYIVLLHNVIYRYRSLDQPFAPKIVVLLTAQGIDSIQIVNNRFLYNVHCVENENVITGFEKWIAIFVNCSFQWRHVLQENLLHPWPLLVVARVRCALVNIMHNRLIFQSH